MEDGKRVRVLTVRYTADIEYHEIPLFRGAVIAAMGDEADVLYHNHIDDDSFRYSYPLIQYKKVGRKAAIVYINEACDLLKTHLTLGDVEMKLGGRTVITRMEKVDAEDVELDVQDTYTKYRIQSWIPFNTENFNTYRQIGGLIAKMTFIQNLLTANILSFAKSLDIIFDKQVDVELLDLGNPQKVKLKGIDVFSFDAEFKSNVCLPENIGLGKAVSKGHGVIKLI